MMIYVVYPDNGEDPKATCVDREVACEIAEFLDGETGVEHWVIDLEVSMTLEDYANDF